MTDTEKKIAEIQRIASSNEFWALGPGDHLNMIDFLLDELEQKDEENRKLIEGIQSIRKREYISPDRETVTHRMAVSILKQIGVDINV